MYLYLNSNTVWHDLTAIILCKGYMNQNMTQYPDYWNYVLLQYLPDYSQANEFY